jgi:hypothetical protein
MALKPFNSVAGFSVGEIPSVNIILANGDITASNATLTGNLLISNANASWGVLTDNLYYSNGVPWDIQHPAGSNTQIQFNSDGDFGASANLTFDPSTNLLTVAGNINVANADLGNLVTANFVNVSSNILTNNIVANNSVSASTLTSTVAIGTAPLTVTSTTKVANLNVDLLDGYDTSVSASANTIPVRDVNGNLSANYFIGNGAFLTGIDAASIQNGTSNVSVLENGNVTFGVAGNANIVVITGTGANIDGNLNVTGNITAANFIGNFSGNISAPGSNTQIVFNDDGITNASANFTFNKTTNVLAVNGNLTTNNANLGNLAVANFVQTGELFNGNSNVVITSNGNVTTTAAGNATLVVSGAGANIVGYVTANGIGSFGGVESNTVTAQGGNLTLSAATGDNYIQLRPTGNGHVDVGNFRIQNLADPINAQDAATKIYVDEVAEGLKARTAADILVSVDLSATYDNGNAGVGATLTATSNGAWEEYDDVTLTVVGQRVLVTAQSDAAENGLYVLDVVGDSSTPWQLRRCKDCDTAEEIPGSYVFIKSGTIYGSTGWVAIVDDPETFVVGTDAINWVQFSGAGTFTAGQGLTLTGTVFSVNTDGITTEISGGNVVVKANAQFTTPNIGAATGTSLEVTGNIVANNITANSTTSTANLNVSANTVTSNLTVNLALAGNTANFTGNITSLNANLGNLAVANFFTGTLINGTSNVVVNNNGNIDLTAGGTTSLVVTSSGANITGYANITGNVSAANLSANIANVNKVKVGNTQVGWGSVTTTSISANQTIATLTATGVTGVEFLVKGMDSAGSKYTVATVQAVTDGSNVDYTTYGTVNLGGLVGILAVNVSGSNVALQVTPATANSTLWTAQFRTI